MAIPSRIASLKPSWIDEFRAFIMRGSVVDLAVGIIIGAAFTGVVSSLVKGQRGSVLDELTERERDVLSLIAEGRSNRAIAKQLYLSPRAIERHVQAIFQKLRLPESGDDNRRVLAVLALLGQ